MARNQKLTKVIAGRKIAGVEAAGSALTIRFDDGSVMTIQTGGPAPAGEFAGAAVKAVRQQGTTLDLDLDDGRTLEVTTAEATSSVLLRSGDGTLEYAD